MDKNVYTIEEVDELKAWAEQAEFPAEMQLDKAVYSGCRKCVDHPKSGNAARRTFQVQPFL